MRKLFSVEIVPELLSEGGRYQLTNRLRKLISGKTIVLSLTEAELVEFPIDISERLNAGLDCSMSLQPNNGCCETEKFDAMIGMLARYEYENRYKTAVLIYCQGNKYFDKFLAYFVKVKLGVPCEQLKSGMTLLDYGENEEDKTIIYSAIEICPE